MDDSADSANGTIMYTATGMGVLKDTTLVKPVYEQYMNEEAPGPIQKLLEILDSAFQKSGSRGNRREAIAFGQSDVVQTWVGSIFLLAELGGKPIQVSKVRVEDWGSKKRRWHDFPPSNTRTDNDTYVWIDDDELRISDPKSSFFVALNMEA